MMNECLVTNVHSENKRIEDLENINAEKDDNGCNGGKQDTVDIRQYRTSTFSSSKNENSGLETSNGSLSSSSSSSLSSSSSSLLSEENRKFKTISPITELNYLVNNHLRDDSVSRQQHQHNRITASIISSQSNSYHLHSNNFDSSPILSNGYHHNQSNSQNQSNGYGNIEIDQFYRNDSPQATLLFSTIIDEPSSYTNTNCIDDNYYLSSGHHPQPLCGQNDTKFQHQMCYQSSSPSSIVNSVQNGFDRNDRINVSSPNDQHHHHNKQNPYLPNIANSLKNNNSSFNQSISVYQFQQNLLHQDHLNNCVNMLYSSQSISNSDRNESSEGVVNSSVLNHQQQRHHPINDVGDHRHRDNQNKIDRP
ncbi:TRAF3-interacting protein 1 [Sarcoptes scabiei]|nr:TRAF3-interacting protein 1 [Sarcoptes scabiei]